MLSHIQTEGLDVFPDTKSHGTAELCGNVVITDTTADTNIPDIQRRVEYPFVDIPQNFTHRCGKTTPLRSCSLETETVDLFGDLLLLSGPFQASVDRFFEAVHSLEILKGVERVGS